MLAPVSFRSACDTHACLLPSAQPLPLMPASFLPLCPRRPLLYSCCFTLSSSLQPLDPLAGRGRGDVCSGFSSDLDCVAPTPFPFLSQRGVRARQASSTALLSALRDRAASASEDAYREQHLGQPRKFPYPHAQKSRLMTWQHAVFAPMPDAVAPNDDSVVVSGLGVCYRCGRRRSMVGRRLPAIIVLTS